MTVNPELLRARAAHYTDGELFIEAVALAEVADAVGTPVYVYSSAMFATQYHLLTTALHGLPHRLPRPACYFCKGTNFGWGTTRGILIPFDADYINTGVRSVQ